MAWAAKRINRYMAILFIASSVGALEAFTSPPTNIGKTSAANEENSKKTNPI
jgi:hypothetical protein